MSTIPGAGVQTGEFLLYQTEDEQTRVQVRLTDGTLWLTQKQLADLYQVSVATINGHLRNIYADGELEANRTIRKFRIVALEATRSVERLVDHYNLEATFQVGYRQQQLAAHSRAEQDFEAAISKPVAIIAKTRKLVARQNNKKKGLA